MNTFSSSDCRSKLFLHYTIKSHVKALGLYNFIRGSGWGAYIQGAYKRNEKKNVSEQGEKIYLRNGLKLTYHYI